MKQTPFKAAVVQTLAVLGDVDANIAIVTGHVEEAVRQGAKLVVLPECMNSGYLFDSKEHCLQIAEPVTGRFAQALAALCRKHDLYIASGFTELGDDGRAYNTALLFSPDGDLIGARRASREGPRAGGGTARRDAGKAVYPGEMSAVAAGARTRSRRPRRLQFVARRSTSRKWARRLRCQHDSSDRLQLGRSSPKLIVRRRVAPRPSCIR